MSVTSRTWLFAPQPLGKRAVRRLIAEHNLLADAAADAFRFVRDVAGCIKITECKRPERVEHCPQVLDDWIDAARAICRKHDGGVE